MRAPRHMPPKTLRLISAAATMTLIATLLTWMQPTAAVADTAASPPMPSTVSTDVLPTPQINGVVWDQTIVGNTVYVAGNFTKARPFGAAAGTNEVNRSYMLSYNLTTGALLPWAPTFDSQVRAISASPDGTRLYAVGDFTTVNGTSKSRIVAFDTATGAINSAFDARANYRVYAVVATNSAVYFSGPFTSVSGSTRLGGAAALASNGAVTPWAPELAGGRAFGIVISPDETKVVIGGDFTTVNGSGNPGYGLAMVDATAGALITPFAVNNSVRNAGLNAAIFSLASDSDSFYGSGYVFGSGGNLEGTFRANWSNGEIVWINDCHGDTYSVSPAPNGAIYAAGHSHYCGNIDAFPQTDPWTFSRGIAFSKDATGTISRDPYGYPNWSGNASPSMLNFFPDINLGTFTGQYQGPWDVSANAQYTVYGGEFTRVNGKSQQGLLRFAVPSIAPNLDGPRLTGNDLVPTMTSPAPGTIALSWIADWDRDNENLTYHLIRDGKSASPIYVTTQDARFYDRPTMTYIDTGLTPGQTYTYRLRAIDPYGNNGWGTTVSYTAGATGQLSDYASAVMNDQPTSYWRLGDPSGSTAVDSVGRDNSTANAGVGFGASGAIIGDSNTAANFTGSSNSYTGSGEKVWRDNTFSVEAWFKTSTTAGGKIVGFGNKQSGNSNNYDRHIYMDTSGKVNFGVYTGSTRIVQSARSYNDNQWHQVVGSMGATGMELFVDGVRIGVDPSVVWGQNYWGYWRIGGDRSWSGADYFNGAIDEVAVYPKPLTATQVQNHYLLSGRSLTGPPAPTDSYGAAVYEASPQLYWRLSEASGAVANDAGLQGINGNLSGTYTRDVPGALGGTSNSATRFTQGLAATAVSMANPSTYSSEVWFRTTSTSGGKLVEFGSSAAGTASSYGDHIIMRNDGTLLFGTGSSTVSSAASYNDGNWHQAVSTQGSGGLRLYVDGALAATSPATPSQTFSGFWRLGRGNTVGVASSNYFDGDLDEFAIYQTVLSASDVSSHYLLGTANQAPVAAFTHTEANLVASFDASGSSDPDGTISSYEWNFGDGSTGAVAVLNHTYAAAGTYDVTLKVTDNKGASATTTASVTVLAANVAPTAAFTSTVTENVVSFDGSSSSDPEGTISSYQWNFGDGANDTGATVSHSYAAAGAYTVTLTVADAQGATGTVSQVVTALAPPAVTVLARDEFSRTVASGWGTAVVGGDWSTNTDSNFSVASDAGVVNHSSAGSTRHAWLPSVSTDDVTVSASISVDKPITGGGAFTGLTVREVGNSFYQARVRYFSNGTLAFQLLNGGSTSIAYTEVPGLTFSPGDVLLVKAQAFGTSPTTLRGKVWKSGTAEPTDWTLAASSSVASLQTAGSVGQYSYLSGSAVNAPVRVSYDSFLAVAGHAEGGVVPVNQAPTASFTSSVNALTASFNSSASADPDGSIASRTWAFGDGQTSTAISPDHTYATAGTYQVTLTVTDNQGATGSVTKPVTVTANPANQPPVAAFTLDLAGLAASFNGNGSSDPDGSIASYAWNFGDGQTGTGATASHSYASAGSYTVTLTITDNQGATTAVTHVVAPNPAADVPQPAKTVVVIMENKSDTQIIGSAQAPFINSLAGDGALMTESFAVVHPSQPNYLALFSGSLNGVTTNDCPNTFTTTNLYNQLTANGKSFVGYSESLPSVGFTGCESGDYARKHNPWVNWPSIPAAVNQPFTAFPTDYATLPDVSFVVPDLQHDMHDGTITEADTWLQSALGGYVTWAKANNSVLILTWDENDGRASNQIATIFVGEKVKIGQYSQTIDHYDVLRTIQDAYSVPSNDLSAAAAPITNIWLGANQTPTAAFTSATADLTASFDGSTSSDPDGTISSYSWNFGDGQTGTGATTTHDYATAGNYTVVLTVTDNQGATGSVSHQVTVTAAGGPIALDDFTRTVAAGWGTANTGGGWSTNVNSAFTVSSGSGLVAHATPGSTRRALLTGVSQTAVEAQVEISADKVAESGHIVMGIIGRQVGSAFYQARARLQPGGAVGLQIMSGSSTVLANMNVPGLSYVAGDTLILKTSVSGTNPTTITAKLWKAGDAEPAGWQLSTTDSTAALQAAGSIGFESYLSSSAPNAPVAVRLDNFLARLPQ
ncbi:PKD domain-containing protein [Salinibacterium sp. TMP30]|uniref:PKD domain-containing protein n=1 Tax=Salinibacterium sp. TMP30 TaxID=3138237 RepID=UPI00313A136F